MLRIAIIGMGLIGASLGMALRSVETRESPLGPLEVLGWDSNPQATREARGRLAIDREGRSLAETVSEASIVVIATPVQSMRTILAQLGSLLPAGTIVTDVASTKAEVSKWAAASLPAGVAFVGGHPMAGKEHAGVAAADPALFNDAIYCLTVSSSTPPAAVETVEAMVRMLGARPYYIDPHEHDAYVAGISHLPMLLSVALVEITGRSPAWQELSALAASGFRDVSRLASGDPQMHRDICLTNPVGISRWLNEMAAFLLDLRDQIEAGDSEAIVALLERAKAQRDAWLDARPGLRPGEAAFLNQPTIERPNLLGFRRPGGSRKG